MVALRPFGMQVTATGGFYDVRVDSGVAPTRPIVLTERGDTVTENALLAAARRPGTTVIRNASPNYMVQDLCFYLTKLGISIDGIGTTTLVVHGVEEISCDVDYSPSEDPIEAMSLITAGIVTNSQLTIRRAPIQFLEIELALLCEMGLRYDGTDEYPAANGRTRLVDLTTQPSTLRAPIDKVHPMPFPGLSIDNLPFFAVIAAAQHLRHQARLRGAGRAARLDRRTRRTVLRWHGRLTDSAPSTYSRPRTVTRRYACRAPSNDS